MAKKIKKLGPIFGVLQEYEELHATLVNEKFQVPGLMPPEYDSDYVKKMMHFTAGLKHSLNEAGVSDDEIHKYFSEQDKSDPCFESPEEKKEIREKRKMLDDQLDDIINDMIL